MGNLGHSVELIEEKCIGCTDCIKRCPTEAIRVRNGKAVISEGKCIDCGLCIQVCSHHAKIATLHGMEQVKKYKYKVAIPAPALYAQFPNEDNVNAILTAIKRLGFDEVFEVSRGAELVTAYTKKMIESKDLKRPIISAACPAVVRLICMRFPSLIGNILPVLAPVEVAAIAAKNVLEAKGVPREDIGVFFISPCAAKNTYVDTPLGIEKSEIDGVISMQDIYLRLVGQLKKLDKPEILMESTEKGVDWAIIGGEGKGLYIDNAIAVDGVDNVIQVLEELENGQLEDVDFIEGLACTVGCVGGPLTVVNGFVAKNRLRKIEKKLKQVPETEKRVTDWKAEDINFEFTKPLRSIGALKLDEDMMKAMEKLEKLVRISGELPMIDCGACGAPTCRALAEDIVRENAHQEDCVFMLRRKIKELAGAMVDLTAKMPQTASHEGKEKP